MKILLITVVFRIFLGLVSDEREYCKVETIKLFTLETSKCWLNGRVRLQNLVWWAS